MDLSSLAVAVPPPDRLFALATELEAEWPRVLSLVRDLNATPPFSVRPVFIQDGPGLFPAGVLATMPRWGQPWKELYRYKGESLEQAQARWIAEAEDIERRWGYDLGAVLQTYTMNGLYTVDEVQAIAAVGITHLNDRGPRWKMAPNFAYARADGGDIPALAELQRTICRQSPGWPELEPVEHPIPPPPVRVSSVVPLC